MDSLQVGKAGFVSQQYACHHQRDASWHKISQVSQLQLQHPNRHPKRFVFINIPWVILNIYRVALKEWPLYSIKRREFF